MVDKTLRLNVALADAKAVCDHFHIPYGKITKIKINTRATSRFGLCRKLKDGTYEIEISKFLLDDETQQMALMNTVIHEVLHTCPGGMTHKGMWKTYANVINRNTNYTITRCATNEEVAMVPAYEALQKDSTKYEITCLHCGKQFKYKRAGSVVKSLLRKPLNSTCSCPYCKSHDFKVVTA